MNTLFGGVSDIGTMTISEYQNKFYMNIGGADDQGFVSSWNFTLGTPTNVITLVGDSSYSYDCIIDWGDGTQSTITSWDDVDLEHTYNFEELYASDLDTADVNGEGVYTYNPLDYTWGNENSWKMYQEYDGIILKWYIQDDSLNNIYYNVVDFSTTTTTTGIIETTTTTLPVAYYHKYPPKSGWIRIADDTKISIDLIYADSSNTTISIEGTCEKLLFSNNLEHLTAIHSIGNLGWLSFDDMFKDCINLKFFNTYIYYIEGLELFSITTLVNMFSGCTSIVSIDLRGFQFGSLVDLSYMFYNCSSLTQLYLPDLTFDPLVVLDYMFSGSGFTTLDLLDVGFGTLSAIEMFSNMPNIQYLYLNDFDIEDLDCNRFFYNCPKLLGVFSNLSKTNPFKFYNGNINSNIDEAFAQCPKLQMPINGATYWITDTIGKHRKLFYGSTNIPNHGVSYTDGAMTYPPIPIEWGGGYSEFVRAYDYNTDTEGIENYLTQTHRHVSDYTNLTYDNISDDPPTYINNSLFDITTDDSIILDTLDAMDTETFSITNDGTAELSIYDANTISVISNGNIYNIKVLDSLSALWAQYSCSEGAGVRIYDITGNGRHGDISSGEIVIGGFTVSDIVYETYNNNYAGSIESIMLFGSNTIYLAQYNNVITQYTISTQGDITSTIIVDEFSVNSQVNPRYLDSAYISSDGTRLFVIGNAYDTEDAYIYQYALSIPFDLNTATYTTLSLYIGNAPTTGLFFSTDGTKMYISQTNQVDISQIVEYTLSTPWLLSSASITYTLDMIVYGIYPESGVFIDNGVNMLWIVDSTLVSMNLSTAWDLSTAVEFDFIDLSTYSTYPLSVAVDTSNHKIYISEYNTDSIMQFSY